MNIRIVNRLFLGWFLLGLLASVVFDPALETAFGALRFWLILAPIASFVIFNASRLCELTGYLLVRR